MLGIVTLMLNATQHVARSTIASLGNEIVPADYEKGLYIIFRNSGIRIAHLSLASANCDVQDVLESSHSLS